MPFFSTVYIKTCILHFDVVLSEFIHPCTQMRKRAQYSLRDDAAVCVRALQMCVCVCVCVCARASDVCGKLLTQHSTVTPTIPRVFYARLVPSGSPYIES